MHDANWRKHYGRSGNPNSLHSVVAFSLSGSQEVDMEADLFGTSA